LGAVDLPRKAEQWPVPLFLRALNQQELGELFAVQELHLLQSRQSA
jgi:hypothetical protein